MSREMRPTGEVLVDGLDKAVEVISRARSVVENLPVGDQIRVVLTLEKIGRLAYGVADDIQGKRRKL